MAVANADTRYANDVTGVWDLVLHDYLLLVYRRCVAGADVSSLVGFGHM